jgi:hypothetical protein
MLKVSYFQGSDDEDDDEESSQPHSSSQTDSSKPGSLPQSSDPSKIGTVSFCACSTYCVRV